MKPDPTRIVRGLLNAMPTELTALVEDVMELRKKNGKSVSFASASPEAYYKNTEIYDDGGNSDLWGYAQALWSGENGDAAIEIDAERFATRQRRADRIGRALHICVQLPVRRRPSHLTSEIAVEAAYVLRERFGDLLEFFTWPNDGVVEYPNTSAVVDESKPALFLWWHRVPDEPELDPQKGWLCLTLCAPRGPDGNEREIAQHAADAFKTVWSIFLTVVSCMRDYAGRLAYKRSSGATPRPLSDARGFLDRALAELRADCIGPLVEERCGSVGAEKFAVDVDGTQEFWDTAFYSWGKPDAPGVRLALEPERFLVSPGADPSKYRSWIATGAVLECDVSFRTPRWVGGKEALSWLDDVVRCAVRELREHDLIAEFPNVTQVHDGIPVLWKPPANAPGGPAAWYDERFVDLSIRARIDFSVDDPATAAACRLRESWRLLQDAIVAITAALEPRPRLRDWNSVLGWCGECAWFLEHPEEFKWIGGRSNHDFVSRKAPFKYLEVKTSCPSEPVVVHLSVSELHFGASQRENYSVIPVGVDQVLTKKLFEMIKKEPRRKSVDDGSASAATQSPLDVALDRLAMELDIPTKVARGPSCRKLVEQIWRTSSVRTAKPIVDPFAPTGVFSSLVPALASGVLASKASDKDGYSVTVDLNLCGQRTSVGS